MPKINPRIKSIDDLLGLDAAEERPIEPTPSVSLPSRNTASSPFPRRPFVLSEAIRSGCMRATGSMIW